MGVPREPVRLVGAAKEPSMIAERSRKDWTPEMNRFSTQRAEGLKRLNLSGHILKKDPPSCIVEKGSMRTYRLHTRLWLPQSRTRIFEFFSNPRNLQRITPPWLCFEILTPDTIEIKPGVLLDYRLKIRGVPLRWQSKIAVWEPPARFVDEQSRGPYALWIHEHTFREQNSGTVVADDVMYSAFGGRIIQKLLVAPELRRIFKYRQGVLQELFGSR
jgi:ligand-binding SRPBCC domain-containing protein